MCLAQDEQVLLVRCQGRNFCFERCVGLANLFQEDLLTRLKGHNPQCVVTCGKGFQQSVDGRQIFTQLLGYFLSGARRGQKLLSRFFETLYEHTDIAYSQSLTGRRIALCQGVFKDIDLFLHSAGIGRSVACGCEQGLQSFLLGDNSFHFWSQAAAQVLLNQGHAVAIRVAELCHAVADVLIVCFDFGKSGFAARHGGVGVAR